MEEKKLVQTTVTVVNVRVGIFAYTKQTYLFGPHDVWLVQVGHRVWALCQAAAGEPEDGGTAKDTTPGDGRRESSERVSVRKAMINRSTQLTKQLA